jgi:hypothetical protein
MNADPREEQEALEQATAAADAPPTELAPETQSLREAWLAFGQLLESVPLPEMPKVKRRIAPRRWPLLVAVASAVCVLICLDVARIWNNAKQPSDVSPLPAVVASNSTAQPVTVDKQPPESAAAAELAWDDSLDQQIAQVGQQIAAVQPAWSDRLGAFDAVQYELQQVEQEIEKDKL